jgi:hypothetical protein
MIPLEPWMAQVAPAIVGGVIAIFGWFVYRHEAAKVAVRRRERGDKYQG